MYSVLLAIAPCDRCHVLIPLSSGHVFSHTVREALAVYCKS